MKKDMAMFQLYLISYLQNELVFLSIQQKEPNICNQDIMYKTTINAGQILVKLSTRKDTAIVRQAHSS